MRLVKFIKFFIYIIFTLLIAYFVRNYVISLYKIKITNPHDYQYIQNPEYKICPPDQKVLFIAFVVISAHDYVRRKLIRETWGNTTEFPQMRVIFALAKGVDEITNRLIVNENSRHNDIVQEDFIDTYKTLTLKVIMAFKWINKYCPQAQYVIRVNHHVVLNTYAMVKFLDIQRDVYKRDKNSFFGFILDSTGPVRNPNDKFYVSEEQLRGNYNKYMEGSAFILTIDAVKLFYEKSLSLYWPPFSVWLDDVYMGMLARKSNTKLIDISKHFVPAHQNQDRSQTNILKILSEKTALSTLFILSDDKSDFFWDLLRKGMKNSYGFKEL